MRVSKHNFMLRRSVAAVMMTLPVVYSFPALAQSAGGEKAEGEMDRVIVTARKREELIQDVPGAVTALSGAQLDKKALPDITALTDIVPNTTLKASRGTNTTLTAFIRGIGQQDPVAGYEQGVGIYLDDVYLARPQGALTDIYDLERIEVLRGARHAVWPQHHRRRRQIRHAQAVP
jgi:iron complex outermembrane receptor protein